MTLRGGFCALTGAAVALVCAAGQASADELGRAAALHEQAGRLIEAERNDEAIPLLERVVEIRERLLGPKHVDLADALKSLGVAHMNAGRESRARTLYERALNIAKPWSANPLLAAKLHYNLAVIHDNGYRLAEAEHHAREGLELAASLGPGNQATPRLLMLLAVNLSHQERTAESVRTFERAVAAGEAAYGADHYQVAVILQNFATELVASVRIDEARSAYQRAGAIFAKQRGPNSAAALLNAMALARLDVREGRAQQAVVQLEKLVETHALVVGADHPDNADFYESLAWVHIELAQYDAAERRLRQAIELRERVYGKNHAPRAQALMRLASIYFAQGRRDESWTLQTEALSTLERALGADHPWVAAALLTVASRYQEVGMLGEAESRALRARKIYRARLPSDRLEHVVALQVLARIALAKGDASQAAKLAAEARAIVDPRYPGYIGDVEWLQASIEFHRGDFAAGERHAASARERTRKRKGEKHPDIASNLLWLQSEAVRAGRIDAAVDYGVRASGLLDHNMRIMLASGTELKKRAYMKSLLGTAWQTVALHLHYAAEDPRASRLALDTVLRYKGRVVDAQGEVYASARRELGGNSKELDELQSLCTRRANRNWSAKGDGDENLADRIHELEAKLARQSGVFRDTREQSAVTVDDVARRIPDDAALIELFAYAVPDTTTRDPKKPWQPKRYAAYVVKRDGAFVGVDLGPAKAIDDGIDELGRAVIFCSMEEQAGRSCDLAGNLAEVQRIGRQLDQRIMQPLRPLLGGVKHLLVSPDDRLNNLPIDLLRSPAGRWLIQDVRITLLDSGRHLLRSQRPAAARSGAVIIADPDYGAIRPDAASTSWERLPGTAEEADAVARVLPGAVAYRGAAATEKAFKQLRGPSIVHVATHGFFPSGQSYGDRGIRLMQVGPQQQAPALSDADEVLMKSGLVFAGANQRASDGEDGMLSASEVVTVDLHGTHLVVLSACETGVAEAIGGDGVYGLRRSLAIAGAESLVMSLWQVSDLATRDLMVSFYGHLDRGVGRSEALRRAKLELLASEAWNHPYFWAAFLPSGSWAPLPGKTPPAATAGPPPPGRSSRGCGCESGSGPAGLLGIVLACAVVCRRRSESAS